MQLSENIAAYRRARGMTQEELGMALGVTNQAVSKWENAVSLPDVTLLPALARALGITLDQLFGEGSPGEDYLHPDEVPEAAYHALHATLDRLWRHGSGSAEARIAARKEKLARLKSGLAECIADTCGGVLVTDSLSLVDRTFRQPDDEALFRSPRLAAVLESMADEATRIVLACLFRESFRSPEEEMPFFTAQQIAANCGIPEASVHRALFALENLHIVEISQDLDPACCLRTSHAICALELFKIAGLLVNSRTWHEVRNPQVILDACFCGYLPPYQPQK